MSEGLKWTTKKVEMTDFLTATIRRMYLQEKKSSLQIASHVGHSKGWVLAKLRGFGIVRPLREALAVSVPHRAAITRKGPKCPRWKGGIRHNSAGWYTSILIPTHPNADPAGYVLEHRLIMEAHLGRLLGTREHVHHINEIKTDNRLENLELLSQSNHMACHANARPRTAGGTFAREKK